MTNLEAAAHDFAKQKEYAYIQKRGGSVPVKAALDVYLWAYSKFQKENGIAA